MCLVILLQQYELMFFHLLYIFTWKNELFKGISTGKKYIDTNTEKHGSSLAKPRNRISYKVQAEKTEKISSLL